MTSARAYDYQHAYELLVHLDGPKKERLQAAIDSGDAVEIGAAVLAARFGLKGYDPNEPRDPHTGEWGDGSGAVSAARELLGNKPAPRSQFFDEQIADMQHAVSDAVQRHPELTRGRQPLLGMAFASGNRPHDVSVREWDAARFKMAADHADALNSFVPNEGSLILINDMQAMRGESLDNPHNNVPATSTAYGIATHEIGHAYFAALGYWGHGAAEQLLSRFGISPGDLIGYSDYGAASPKEALAELYAQAHTPGHSLPIVLAQKFERLEAYASQHPVGGAQTAPLLTSDPEINQQIAKAAKQNAQAGKWVVRVPALDGNEA